MAVLINGLIEQGEYIDFGESWLVCLKEPGHYKIHDREKYIHNSQLFVKCGTEVYKIKKGLNKLSHYRNPEGLCVSKQEWDNLQYKYKGQYEDEDGYIVYPTLDIEYGCRKELSRYKDFEKVFKKEDDVLTPVSLTCVGTAEDPDSPYITTALCYGKAGFGNSGFYKVNYTKLTSDTFWSFVDKHNLREYTANSDNRDYVRFAKIKDKYVVSESVLGSNKDAFRVYNSLDEANRCIENHVKTFISKLNIQVFGYDSAIKSATSILLWDKLNTIENCVAKIDPKQKSRDDKNRTIKVIKETIALLEDSFSTELEEKEDKTNE